MKRVDLAGVAFEQASGAPLALLREQDAPHRVLPIFIGGPEAASIAVAVSGQEPPRPLTHDVMAALLESLDATIDAAEVTELSEGSYRARLTVSGAGRAHHLDARPSDAIALAVRLGAPLLVSEDVLDEAGSVPSSPDDELDDADIDEAVEEFRSFLDDTDPAQFALEPPTTAETDVDAGRVEDDADQAATAETDVDAEPPAAADE